METMTNQITGDVFANTYTHQSPGGLSPEQPNFPQGAYIIGSASADRPMRPDLAGLLRNCLGLVVNADTFIDTASSRIREAMDLLGDDEGFDHAIDPLVSEAWTCIDRATKCITETSAQLFLNLAQLEKLGVNADPITTHLGDAHFLAQQTGYFCQNILRISEESGGLREFIPESMGRSIFSLDYVRERTIYVECSVIRLKALSRLLRREISQWYRRAM